MIEQLLEFSAEYPAHRALMGDEAYVRESFKNLIDNHFFKVAEDEKGRAGFIVGLVTPHFFNPNLKVLTEILWWVSKARRMSRAAAMLLKEFTEWGLKNVDWIVMGMESISPLNPRTLRRRGYQLKEHNYIMEVP